MSLLPKTFHDFSSKQYWNTFFSKRGEKAFEWYGEYTELCGLLHKYIRPSNNILVAGCGNSTLSADLYKVGYRKITNVDNSEVVIKQMKDKHRQQCPEMQWLKMDLAALDLPDEAFSCVLDKAALDALMTDASLDVVEFVNKYFSEVGRVLRVGGRFVCVSLLQEHILQHVLAWFPKNGWMVRVCRCEDAEKSQADSGNFSFPVFVVVCTKFKQLPNFKPVVELQVDGETAQRVECVEEVMDRVRELQQYAFLRHTMHTKSLAGESTSVQLCDPASGTVRYTLHVVDSDKTSHSLKFAVFIVPLGREREWLFGSGKGREQLAESAGAARLLVVHLHRCDGPSRTLQEIQDELSPKVMELAPSRLPSNTKIPFLSVGEEVGEVKEVAQGHSELSGSFVVEDIHPPGAPPIRRLVFLSNQAVVQSEARILLGKTNEDKSRKKKRKGGGGGGRQVTLDHSHLSCHHHLAMISGLPLAPACSPVLIVGLGGGPLATFIHTNFTQVSVVAVELDAAMVDVAQKWFGFVPDARLKVEVCDGLDYVRTAAEKGLKFGAILFDVDSKDASVGISCPPMSFLEPSFLQDVASCLVEGGVFIVNLVCRDDNLRQRVLADLRAVFPSILLQDIPEEVNCVLHCLREAEGGTEELKRRFESSVEGLSVSLRKRHKKDVADLTGMMKNLSVL